MKTFSPECICDRGLKLWAIPSLALIAAAMFTRDAIFSIYFLLDYFSFTLGFWLIWEANRFIILRAYKEIPTRAQFKKRLQIQLGLGIPISLFIGIGLLILHVLFIKGKSWAECEFIPEARELALPIFMITLCVNALYEGYFLNRLWQESVLEAEQYKKANLEAKFKHLKDQVNPHFLFNSLNTVASLIEEHPKRAVAYVEKLSEVYRYLLNYKDQEVVSLGREIDFAKSYLFLLKMRFEDNLKIELDLPETYLTSYHIPPLTLQMLIENAIKHNEIQRDKPLHIRISIEHEQLVVSNSLQKKMSTHSTGIGLENIRQRYQFLTQAKILIQETVEAFVVKLPLLNISPAVNQA